MLIAASVQNMRKHARALLGNEYSPEREEELIKACCDGFERTRGHISHDYASHLEKINKVLGTCGVEGILEDDIDMQYCNTGDTYAMTLLYFKGRLRIGDWGSIVETCGR